MGSGKTYFFWFNVYFEIISSQGSLMVKFEAYLTWTTERSMAYMQHLQAPISHSHGITGTALEASIDLSKLRARC